MISGIMDGDSTTLTAVVVSSFAAVLLLLLLVLGLVLRCRRRQRVANLEREGDEEEVDECPVYGIYYFAEGDQVDEGRTEAVEINEDYETSSIH